MVLPRAAKSPRLRVYSDSCLCETNKQLDHNSFAPLWSVVTRSVTTHFSSLALKRPYAFFLTDFVFRNITLSSGFYTNSLLLNKNIQTSYTLLWNPCVCKFINSNKQNSLRPWDAILAHDGWTESLSNHMQETRGVTSPSVRCSRHYQVTSGREDA
jgi:hypothetical protein